MKVRYATRPVKQHLSQRGGGQNIQSHNMSNWLQLCLKHLRSPRNKKHHRCPCNQTFASHSCCLGSTHDENTPSL